MSIEVNWFCILHQDYLDSSFCYKCDIATTKIEIPENASLEFRLSLPLGCCTDCRTLELSGNQCWEKHFGKD